MTEGNVTMATLPPGKDLTVNNDTDSKVEATITLGSGTKIVAAIEVGAALRINPSEHDRSGIVIECRTFDRRPKLSLVSTAGGPKAGS